MDTPFATLLGYDPALLEQLPSADVKALDRLVEAWLLSCLLFACPVAYALWLIEHALWLAAMGGLSMFGFVLLLLRLSVTGGGAAPHLPRSELQAWTPALGPSSILCLLALLLSQPAQLPFWRSELAGTIDAHRKALTSEQQMMREQLDLPALYAPNESQTRSEFLALRLKSMWRKNAPRALGLSFLYALLVMQPALWARLFGLKALRAYELKRIEQMTSLIRRDTRRTQALVKSQLERWAP